MIAFGFGGDLIAAISLKPQARRRHAKDFAVEPQPKMRCRMFQLFMNRHSGEEKIFPQEQVLYIGKIFSSCDAIYPHRDRRRGRRHLR